MHKLPFPKHLLNTQCLVELNTSGLNEQGEPEAELTWEGKVIFTEKSRTTVTADKRLIRLEGSIIIQGDIAPGMCISDGRAVVGVNTYDVYRAEKARNPDGTIHHTLLELM